MASSTRNPQCVYTVAYYFLTTSPVSAGNVIYGLYDPKYALRVIQTHTVGFYGPIRSR